MKKYEMKRKWIYGSAIILLLICFAFWLRHFLNPAHRFDPDSLPVLAVPQLLVPEVSSPPFELTTAPKQKISAVSANVLPTEKKKTEGFNILLLGIDRRSNEPSRTDSIILIHVDIRDKKSVVISLPRDTRMDIPGIGLTKVNHVHFIGESQNGNKAGTQAVIQAVSNFFNTPIHYYIKTDFTGFKRMIDTVGGVEVQLPVPITVSGRTWEAGKHILDGETALHLARERYSLPNGDFGRQVDQIAILRSAAEKLLSPDQWTNLPGIVEQLWKSILDTNFTNADLTSLAWVFKGIKGSDLEHIQIPGAPLTAMDPLVGRELWYWVPDQKSVDAISNQYLH